jgi:hypothetical protein
MEFNGSPGDLMELSALFTDDARVAEAAAVAQKLSKLEFGPFLLLFDHSFWEKTHVMYSFTFHMGLET